MICSIGEIVTDNFGVNHIFCENVIVLSGMAEDSLHFLGNITGESGIKSSVVSEIVMTFGVFPRPVPVTNITERILGPEFFVLGCLYLLASCR